jgi:hypothetical protein
MDPLDKPQTVDNEMIPGKKMTYAYLPLYFAI